MKLEEKNNKPELVTRRQQQQQLRSNENQESSTTATLNGVCGRIDRSRRSLNLKPKRKRNINPKLCKSILESSEQLNYLVTHNMSPHQQSPPSSRSSKLNTTRPRKSHLQTADDNLENNRPYSTVQQKQPKPNRSRRRQTLNEKSLNSLIINCFDETSNNSQGNSDYSVDTTISSSSSDGLHKYSLNVTSVEISNKALKLKENVLNQVQVVKEPEALVNSAKLIQKEQETVNANNECVIVPSFRIKTIKMGFRIEGTENINDDMYEKKHQKLENEEIKIQKWDLKRQQYEYEKIKALQKENRLSIKTPASTPSTQSTTTSAQSSPIKRFNAKLPINPHSISITDNSFPLVEDNEMYIIEILDDDGKVNRPKTVETTHQVLTPEQKTRKKSIKSNADSSLVTKSNRSNKKKEPVLLISVKGLTNNKRPKKPNTTSPFKRKPNTSLSELNVSEPSNKRRRLNV